MVTRALRRVSGFTLDHPVLVLAVVAALSVLLQLNTRHLRLQTSLLDLMGSSSPEAVVAREFVEGFGYGNRFFVVIEAGTQDAPDAERLEGVADRLVNSMRGSGLFATARSGFSQEELVNIAGYYVGHFPAFADPAQRDALAARLSPAGIRDHLASAAAGLVTPFSSAGSAYFIADPLGLLEFTAPATREARELSAFDLEWGDGGRFFSKDHRSLLVMTEPRGSASDYEFAVTLMGWYRDTARAAVGADADIRLTPVGAHAYTEQSRRFIQHNIGLATFLSAAGNLLLCLLVYRWIGALVFAFLPTVLAVQWTMGLISTYPGEVNLISLAFIAIIVGLGDDQVTYFFSRVPQEIAKGRSLRDAIGSTYVTTGASVLFCIVTTSTGTLMLARSSFKGLAELGLFLTVALFMLLVHTLVTMPALLALWWTAFPVRDSDRGGPFRFLPTVGRGAARLVTSYPRAVLTTGLVVLVTAAAAIPSMRVSARPETLARYDDAAFVGQRLLASRFGLEGAPLVLLVEGSEAEVLTRTEGLQRELDSLKVAGGLRSVMSPASLLPAPTTQRARQRALDGIDLSAAARALEDGARDAGLAKSVVADTARRLRAWSVGPVPLIGLVDARRELPGELLDNQIRRMPSGRYLAAVTLYSADPALTAALPAATLARLRERVGPFVEFSYERIASDLQTRIATDGRLAALLTLACVAVIVFFLFRRIRTGLLVLMPIGYAVVATVGVLALAGHTFSGMAFAAFPLIIGIGIDNSIHMVRRYLEPGGGDVQQLITATAPALIQTNLTTLVGFGALLSTTFQPLVELGLVTTIGIAFVLGASLLLVPAWLALFGHPRGASSAL
jgi:predicted exporter